MNKILIAIAALVFAAGAMLTPTAPAQAGWKGRLAVGLALGAIGAMSHHHRYERRHWRERRFHARRKAVEKKVYTHKKPSSSTEEVAKVEIPPIPEQKVIVTAAENENSSISTAAVEPVEETAAIHSSEPTTEPAKVVAEVPETEPANGQKAANKLDCKKFFPAVGMTLSVPCE
jgi:hypothetical protein